MTKRIRIILAIAAIISANLAALCAQAELALLDKVAAVVRKDVITESELNQRVSEVMMRARANKRATPPPIEDLKPQVLEHLILEELQLQTARNAGVTVDDSEVNQAIERIRASNKMSTKDFYSQLRADGFSIQAFQEKVRRDLTLQHVQQGIVSQRIAISDLEIDTFLKSAEGQFWTSPEYNIGHILIPLPQSPSAEKVAEIEKKANDLYQQLKQGAQFQSLAISHSKGPKALSGGDLGWRKTSDLPSLFAEIVPALEINQVAEPARSGAGFHILKLKGKRGETSQVITQSNVRHILVKPSAILNDDEAKQKLIELRQQIIDGADFAELAKNNSEDIGSMLSGGELGWSNPGQFVPEFEKAMADTPVKEISQPFSSQFGWHILQVMEQREEDMTELVLRNKARNVLTSRRFEDELQVWQREIRDDAFVEIKIPLKEI